MERSPEKHKASLETQFPLKRTVQKELSAPPSKAVRVVGNLEEAFQAFDELDEGTGSMEFILQKPSLHEAVTHAIPPIPEQAEVDGYLLKNSLLLIDAGEYVLARNVLGDVLKRDSNNVEAIRWMGWCFKQEGDFENALKCYEQLSQRRVTDQDLFELGEIYYSLNRDSEAQATWIDALGQCDAESPRLFDLHKNLGNVFTRAGDYESAEENYNKALTIRPQSDVLQVNLGSLQFQKKNFIGAMEHFKKAVELNSFNDKAWCGVALVAREMNDPEWANSVIKKSLDINPYNLTALQVLVNWAQADWRWDDAIDHVQKYLEREQSNADMVYTLAGLYFQKGDLDKAEVELTRVAALDPSRADVAEFQGLIAKKRKLSI